MEWESIAKSLIILGGLFLLMGILLYAFGRLHLPLGRLPGDIVYRRGNFTCICPLATSLLLSLILTLVLNLLARRLR